jgi:hypothetical protein
MKYKDKLLKDIVKVREVDNLKSFPGWSHIQEFVLLEEATLQKKLMRASADKVDRIRGGLDTLNKFKTFLSMLDRNASDAHNELQKLLDRN